MSKVKNLILGTVMTASMIACSPKANNNQGVRENIKKDLIETIVAGETEEDVLHIKKFNQAIMNHDMEGALYNLASAYLNRSIYMKGDPKNGGVMKLSDDAYGLLPQIKEFSTIFGKDADTKEISDMTGHGEFGGIGSNTLGGAMRIILNWSESLRNGKLKNNHN